MAKVNKWNNDEIEWLRLHYESSSWDEMCSFLNRDAAAIKSKAHDIGVRRGGVRNARFSDEEIYLIRTYWTIMDEDDFVAIYMPTRTTKSIQTAASRHGIRRRAIWTDEDDMFIRDNYTSMTTEEIHENMPHHSRMSILQRIKKIGLVDAPRYKYSSDAIDFVLNNYESMTDKEIGVILHRAPQSIKEMRRKIGALRVDTSKDRHYGDIDTFLHRRNHEWRRKAMEDDMFVCALSGDPFSAVHHIYGNNLIIQEALAELGIDCSFDVDGCTQSDRDILLDTYLRIQDKYPTGICLSEDMHRMFHKRFGYGNNTPDQFIEFVNDVAPDRINDVMRKF